MPPRPVRAAPCPDGRLGALPGPGAGGDSGAPIVKRPVDPAGAVKNPRTPDQHGQSAWARPWPARNPLALRFLGDHVKSVRHRTFGNGDAMLPYRRPISQ